MAFEQLERFVDTIAKEYKRNENILYMLVLSDYYNTVLSHAKFKSQRLYCEKKMFELNPSYCNGFFKKEKP